MSIREHKHRLHQELYQGTIVCSFTCCVENKERLFVSADNFFHFEKILHESLTRHKTLSHVYVFMPDHIHLILEGQTYDANALSALTLFKQKTGYFLSQNNSTFKLQKDFYDHILRKDEDVFKQVAYILNNPVRAGLVENWYDYPYKGSMLYDLSDANFL